MAPIMTKDEFKEYQAYKATGVTPEEIIAWQKGVYPDDEDRAPLPPLSTTDFAYDRRLELRDDFRDADLTREDIHLGAGLLEDE